jgi:hypothetical protein
MGFANRHSRNSAANVMSHAYGTDDPSRMRGLWMIQQLPERNTCPGNTPVGLP